ncbi:DUF4388 domain-containing protein [Aggregatilinea lenta]|uniref:DUF4388 domain-containing protein n=1 Tax=Aggregatilinea lenta TaxID=913108 RepID=UPI000E5B2074|nr:DUF4388 domain-containing protein [Aggregatilinea lenta]
MALKGNLADFSTTQILNLISLAHKTGTLRVYEPVVTKETITDGAGNKRPKVVPGAERAAAWFRDGKLILAAMGSQDGHLANVLHRAGKLNAEQARIIRERGAKYSDKALALMLINANYVNQTDIVRSIQQHTVDIMYDMMAWAKEPFIFQENELPSSDHITVPIDLKNVIIEGTRRIKEIKPLEDELPNLDMALKFPESPSEKFRGIHLSVEEWRVVSFINPKNSIRQIAKACNMTDTEIRRVVYGLLQAGLVELLKPPHLQPQPVGAPGAYAGPPRPQVTVKRSVVERLIARIKES